jgi:hypothetical protein
MNIYLDIDGVLLDRRSERAPYAPEFLKLVLERCPQSTYWLTTHCKGDAAIPLRRIGHLFDAETRALMARIKPTTWSLAKTEAIDLSTPFLWFDDDCFDFERRTLETHGLLDNWIKVDLRRTPHQLGLFIQSFPVPINALR